ncbi:MAG: HAD-IC family P-type ATPase [Nitrospinaceae bacterium]|nr:HAD-IC family P-type ATPase [Nitrospinaceae bacterium]
MNWNAPAEWHTCEWQDLVSGLQTTERGLTQPQAEQRLQQVGPNTLPRKPPPKVWDIVLRQFKSPLIYILGIAALVSLALGDWIDAAFIAGVLGLNALIGGIQEWKAEQSAQALQKLLKIRATVERDREIYEIPAEEVVPGDVVWVESGNRVPADFRLLLAHSLEIDESLLTGESLPVLKDPAWTGPESTSLGDRRNMVHAGTIVARGRAKGIVVATGRDTQVGRLATDVMAAGEGKPPLIIRMERFSQVVALTVLAAAFLVALLGILAHGHSLSEMFFFGVALAVSAIPEGLPVALTVALAIGTTRMARRGVIVRRLAAVEGLGSCTLVASDKTGTLTCNELTIREIRLADGQEFGVTGEGYRPEGRVLDGPHPVDPEKVPLLKDLARASVLCNEADLHHRNGHWIWRGDPTDIALLSMSHKLGWDRETSLENAPQVNQIPFEPEHKYSASYHLVDGAVEVLVKGAPERVLSMCRFPEKDDGGDRHLRTAETLAGQGYRVLAFAQGIQSEALDPSQAPPEPSGLRFLGYTAMIDPLRAGVREAVQDCHNAGVEVCMITGDHPITALAIARELGLTDPSERVVTGAELEQKPPEKLKDEVQQARIFARVAPHQKLDLVNGFRNQGHFVAVTGDGVNDAPALRAANIGVAMGRSGTDVAREAAELVISDDNFATIVAGIEEGRIAYDNIRKVIYLLVSTGAAEVILVTLAMALGMPLPLLPAQLLWLNLVTNGIQDVALAFEPGEGDVLKRKPRPPREPIFNRLMIERTVVAALVIGSVGFGFFSWALQAGWSEGSARNGLLLLMVLFENIHLANCRSETKSAFRLSLFTSPILLLGVSTAFLIHVATLYLPLGHLVLGTQPVDFSTWGLLIALASTVLVVMEIHKWTWNRRRQRAGTR